MEYLLVHESRGVIGAEKCDLHRGIFCRMDVDEKLEIDIRARIVWIFDRVHCGGLRHAIFRYLASLETFTNWAYCSTVTRGHVARLLHRNTVDLRLRAQKPCTVPPSTPFFFFKMGGFKKC